MSGVKRVAAFAGTAALMAAALAACAPQAQVQESPTAQAGAEQTVCDSLAAFRGSVEDLLALDPSTASIDDVKAARRNIDQAWADVRASASSVEIADQEAVEDAWQGLAEAVDDVPTDQPISEAVASIRAQAEEVRAAYAEMADGVGCQ